MVRYHCVLDTYDMAFMLNNDYSRTPSLENFLGNDE